MCNTLKKKVGAINVHPLDAGLLEWLKIEKLADSFPSKLETLIRKHENVRVDIKNINRVTSSLNQESICMQK